MDFARYEFVIFRRKWQQNSRLAGNKGGPLLGICVVAFDYFIQALYDYFCHPNFACITFFAMPGTVSSWHFTWEEWNWQLKKASGKVRTWFDTIPYCVWTITSWKGSSKFVRMKGKVQACRLVNRVTCIKKLLWADDACFGYGVTNTYQISYVAG